MNQPLIPVPASRFGTWVLDQLERSGTTQRELSRDSGVDHSTISRLISGPRDPLLSTAQAIARALICRCGEARADTVHSTRCVPGCGIDAYRHHAFYRSES